MTDDGCCCSKDPVESVTEKLHDKLIPIDEIVDDFTLYGLKKRVAVLEKLDSELESEINSSPHSLRWRMQLMKL